MATFESENGDLTQSDIGMFESEAGDSRKLGDSAAARAGASLTLQRRIFVMLDEPDSGLAAQVISGVVMVMIFASSVSFVMESTQTVRSDPELKGNLHLLENSCIIAFTIEYVARMACCTHRLSPDPSFFKYLVKPMNLVDLCAIAPFYIEMLLAGNLSLGVLRMLRMTRIFRVLKIGSFANDLQLFSDGMSRASEGLLLLFFMLILYFCVFATLLYMFEYQAQLDCRDCPTCGCPAWRGFTSIPTTMYFIMATMTTVGYGDMYPITIEGQLLCGLCMLCGCFVLGLPIVVIGVSFDAAFKEADKWKLEKALAKAEKRRASGGVDPVPRDSVRTLSQSLDEVANPSPEFDDMLALRHGAALLYELYITTGDERFYEARVALMKELPEKLFEPPYPTRPGSAASKPKMVPISPRALAAAAAAEQEYYVQDT